MKKKITKEDQELLNNFVIARDKYKKYKSKNNQERYKKLHTTCVDTFDFLVEKRVARYKQFSNYEDLVQEGRIALLSALKNYKPGLGSFSCWAGFYIKTKISREANKHSTVKIPLKKAKDLPPYKVSKIPERCVNSDVIEKIELENTKSQINNIIKQLPLEQREIIIKLYGLNNSGKNSITSICKEMRIPRNECILRINEAKEKLKIELVKLDL